jgi:hypothetical protein
LKGYSIIIENLAITILLGSGHTVEHPASMSAAKASLLFLPSAVAATMAAWQVQRMQWKVRYVRFTASDLALHSRDASILGHDILAGALLTAPGCAMRNMSTVLSYRLGLHFAARRC